MRMRRSGVLIRAREERGAVLMIVAISLFVVLGMLVLTFDLGRGVAIKRNMVAGTDAAAIAAARECAMGQPMGAAQGAAQTLLTRNNEAATMTSFEADAAQCSGDTNQLQNQTSLVTVKSSVDQEYFFAQIFGFTSGSVVASATAEWGPAIGVANPVPLRLNGSALDACLTHEVGYEGSDCAFGFDNSDPEAQTASQWGILDFPEGWPPEDGANPLECSAQAGGANDVIDYLSGAGPDFFPVLWEIPIYVCAEGGLNANTINWIINWLRANIGSSLIFPVMGPQPPVTQPGGQAWPVVGFVKLTVVGAWKGNEAKQHCTFEKKNASAFCIQLKRDDVEIVDGVPGTGAYYDQLKAIRLVD